MANCEKSSLLRILPLLQPCHPLQRIMAPFLPLTSPHYIPLLLEQELEPPQKHKHYLPAVLPQSRRRRPRRERGSTPKRSVRPSPRKLYPLAISLKPSLHRNLGTAEVLLLTMYATSNLSHCAYVLNTAFVSSPPKVLPLVMTRRVTISLCPMTSYFVVVRASS